MKRCAICGKELRYEFEIEDGVCEECDINRRRPQADHKKTEELERALSYEEDE